MFLNEETLPGNASSVYISIGLVLITILFYQFKSRGIPPGPVGYPYLGLWPILKHDTCHLQMHEMAKKYGDVFSFTYAGRLFIHLGSVKAVKEVHVENSDCFFNRPDTFQMIVYFLDGGVGVTNGEKGKVLRKFFLKQFKERGMTVINESLSGPIYDTVRETITELKETNGQPVNIASLLLSKCGRIMHQTLFDSDVMTDQEMAEFCKGYFKNLVGMTDVNILFVGKFARYFLFPFSSYVNESREGHLIMERVMTEVIKRRKATFDENHIRDTIDAFFKENKDRESKQDPSANYFSDETLMKSLLQIVGDGVLFMEMFVCDFLNKALQHPEEQDKIYNELVEVVGRDRNPEIDDKNKLSYTNAFVREVMRTTDLQTMFTSMECSKETTVAGYRIPKGAITVYNFWAANMNPNDYDEPEKFKPSRFLAKDGQDRPDLMPLFGIGKRSCIGEGFTMLQVFLFLTTILKNFRLTTPNMKVKEKGLFPYLDKIEVCAHPRN